MSVPRFFVYGTEFATAMVGEIMRIRSKVSLFGLLAIFLGLFAVVASAGTTNEGLVDDLADVASVAGEYGVWVHVDGAYGGAGLAAPSVRHLFDGIEQADSFIVDPHKWLFAPYDCCALVYREPERAREVHTQRASYLDHIDRDRRRRGTHRLAERRRYRAGGEHFLYPPVKYEAGLFLQKRRAP